MEKDNNDGHTTTGKGGDKGLPTVPGVYEFELDASLYADDAG